MIKKIENIDTPEELLRLIQSNNKDTFKYLYKKYCATLFGIAFQAVDSKQFAEEIVILTFENLWKCKSCTGKKVSLGTFVLQFHLKTIQDFLRSKNISYALDSNGFPKVVQLQNHQNLPLDLNQSAILPAV